MAMGSRLTRGEVAALAGVPVSVVDKAIEQRVLTRSRGGGRETLLELDAVCVLAVLQRVGVPLPVVLKRRIREWVRETRSGRAKRPPELALSESLVVRYPREVDEIARQADAYVDERERWIVVDRQVKGGLPVIRGTRLSVHALAERVADGDSVSVLCEDYPGVPLEAFEAALVYARARPRRGRPGRRLWREP